MSPDRKIIQLYTTTMTRFIQTSPFCTILHYYYRQVNGSNFRLTIATPAKSEGLARTNVVFLHSHPNIVQSTIVADMGQDRLSMIQYEMVFVKRIGKINHPKTHKVGIKLQIGNLSLS